MFIYLRSRRYVRATPTGEDDEADEDEEADDMFGLHQSEELRLRMSAKPSGADDDIARIEDRNASCLAHEAAIKPAIMESWFGLPNILG
jgi:hypothetical protein